ncbi:unnamed protein product [Caenorhabditis sp. 36 PRJEB53466]|nr:unnamed protein product [Caenorhabditis sp. 36 PRJEB53466]
MNPFLVFSLLVVALRAENSTTPLPGCQTCDPMKWKNQTIESEEITAFGLHAIYTITVVDGCLIGNMSFTDVTVRDPPVIFAMVAYPTTDLNVYDYLTPFTRNHTGVVFKCNDLGQWTFNSTVYVTAIDAYEEVTGCNINAK